LGNTSASTHGLPFKDQAAIAALAEEADTDESVVKCLYAEEIAILQAQARVRNFIGVIAARRVRQRLATARKAGRPVEVRAA
jgi:Protein of unknown function (DUF3562)